MIQALRIGIRGKKFVETESEPMPPGSLTLPFVANLQSPYQ